MTRAQASESQARFKRRQGRGEGLRMSLHRSDPHSGQSRAHMPSSPWAQGTLPPKLSHQAEHTQGSPVVIVGLWDEGTMEASLPSSSQRSDLPSASPHIPLRLTTPCPVSLEIPGRPHPPTKVRPPQSRLPPSLQKAANASEGWNIWLMTGKVLRRQVISTLSSSVGYFNTQYLCKRHNGTCHKLTLSQSSGTSRRG